MTATFKSLRETRMPKAVKAVSLLENLVRYDHTEAEAKDLVNTILDAADDLDAKFAKKWGWQDTPEPEPEPAPHPRDGDEHNPPVNGKYLTAKAAIPLGTAEGGASFEAEVRWALDAVKRGDTALAENRLKRILKGE